ncbi:hypothetical protein [Rhodopirellula baltica]|uniref:Uncharacterized protein n=1 Tax=Rhodopirellula baltica (strain DSM 10527 / NCIMB 13988 / SH1) TaxID=243090 RepID=Q7UEA4_RHOBA|nr:hypothetical protein [Rhodopirellula baltica]CAD79144.1 hypothetical protein RB11475 [Rhodopirellula baltica SH 1]
MSAPYEATSQIPTHAMVAGVKQIGMQLRAEQANESARGAGITVIDDGSCILVLLALQ